MNIKQIINSIFKRTKSDINNEKRQRVAADENLQNEISVLKNSLSSYVKRSIVQSLPINNINTNTIYMIRDFNSTKNRNVYNEYMYINNSWELIGTTEVSGPVYAAGKNIDINDNQISCTGVDIVVGYGSTWSSKTWYNFSDSFVGSSIWTDGNNIYYSNGSVQYVLNKSTSIWTTKTWAGLTNFYGEKIWTDGNNIYYSSGSDQYVLNRATSTWVSKTWSGLSDFYGQHIWTDGDNIYYSDGDGGNHYVLNKSTSTWITKTWTGLSIIYSGNIWTDGENIYYSRSRDHYVLDKSTSTWYTKTWTGLTNFYGVDVWTDGENIYYSDNYEQYVLNKLTSGWYAKTWNGLGLTRLGGSNIWTDGENIYYNTLYSLDKATQSVPALHKVAETGDYNDLKNKPEIPTGGAQLYQHSITILYNDSPVDNITTTIITRNNTPFDYNKILDFLTNNGFTTQNILYEAKGYERQTNVFQIFGLFSQNNEIRTRSLQGNTSQPATRTLVTDVVINDTIIEL